MRRKTPAPRWRALGVLAGLGLLAGAHAAPAGDVQTASATLWSADHSFAPCRSARVEMIVGGVQEPAACRPADASPAASPGVRETAREAHVDPVAQRLRDDDRRGILLQELAREQDGLARLQSAPASEANRLAIERTRTNLAALQRELARTP